jgi:hypothetical protein
MNVKSCLRLVLILYSALFLTACGGGGGGGGGSTASIAPPASPFVAGGGPLAGASSTGKFTDAEASALPTPDDLKTNYSSADGTKSGVGIAKGSVELVNLATGENIVTFEAGTNGVVDHYDTGYIGAWTDKTKTNTSISDLLINGGEIPNGHVVDGSFEGDVSNQTVWVVYDDENIPNGLEFSSFGMWGTAAEVKNMKVDGQPIDDATVLTGWDHFAIGLDANKAVPDPVPFSGNAAAIVNIDGNDPTTTKALYGTADLTLDASLVANLKLQLQYRPDKSEYLINFNGINVNNTTGAFTANDPATTYTYTGPDPRYQFVGQVAHSNVSGQFYGKDGMSGPASEGVGLFGVNGDNSMGRSVEITGSFGVKKK